MGGCASKPPRSNPYSDLPEQPNTPEHDHHREENNGESSVTGKSSPFYSLSPVQSLLGILKSPARPSGGGNTNTPKKAVFPPPSPAKHIMAVLMRRRRRKDDDPEVVTGLDKRFGLKKRFKDEYEVGDEVGRGHFGYTVSATCKSGDHAGEKVAVKVIPKDKMTSAIAVEDVRREVRILRDLSGHDDNLIRFYDAFEDNDHVYMVMELCEGGELLDLILSRGGKFTEDESKNMTIQILNVVAFCHLQGVVHRDLKPENFLLKSKGDDSRLKAIDFGLSDFVKPDEKLNDIVGSAYYVAPEVLLRSYDTEADVWSIGVISYILLCGSRPFWARTESGIFRAVLKTVPSFAETAWASRSPLAKDFVKCLLTKDPRKRLTAAQALSHPWIRDHNKVEVPIDIRVLRTLKAYTLASPLRKAALKALSSTLTTEDLFYLKKQFMHLATSERVTYRSIKTALLKHATNAMKESRIIDYLNWLTALELDFNDFCAAAINVHQLEALDRWEQLTQSAYEIFENDGNKAIIIEELASELGLGPSVPLHVVVSEWIRHSDGKLSYLGFVKLLHGVSTRNNRRLR